MDTLSETSLTERFDQLVAEGVIVYGPHKSVQVEAEEYPISFRICPALATKPHTVGASNPAFDSSRKWGPGSDMFCPDERLIFTQMNGTHDLALNLFCVDRPQLLILTLDSYKRQHEALDQDDFTVMLQTLTKFPSMYTIFNCGERGGCSRVHKHVQGLRGPPHAFQHIIDNIESQAKVPFKFFAHHFPPTFPKTSGADVLAIYTDLLDQTRDVMQWQEDACPPHNVVMWRDWLIVIPRRKGNFEGASANAGGMLGSVWVSSQEHVDEWTRAGCANVLRELGVPA